MTPGERIRDQGRFNDALALMLEDLAAARLRPVEECLALAPGFEVEIRGHHDDARATLEARAAKETGRGAATGGAHEPTPSRIGWYHLVEVIGSSGQVRVYRAIDVRLGRQVALKVLSEELQFSDEALRRFRREAEITSRLDHPGICTVYEAGHEDGRPFIAMRFVEGAPLSRLIHGGARDRGSGDGGSPPVAEDLARAALIVEKTARALHAAHQAGVIHRDVKPQNIIVKRDDEPVIVDFGLARRLDLETVPVTLASDILGTLHYMSPEHFEPGTGSLDRRTDVYALGVTLFEALTRKRPFEAKTRDALISAIRCGDSPDCRAVNPVISRDLRLVVRTAMERDPSHRYRTAIDLAEDLQRIRERRPILARPLPPFLRFRRFVQLHARAALFLGLLSLVVFAALLFLVPAAVLVETEPPGAEILLGGLGRERVR